jgi:hypothetical protein
MTDTHPLPRDDSTPHPVINREPEECSEKLLRFGGKGKFFVKDPGGQA